MAVDYLQTSPPALDPAPTARADLILASQMDAWVADHAMSSDALLMQESSETLPNPQLPPPPTEFKTPAIPNEMRHLDQVPSVSVAVQLPATPREFPPDVATPRSDAVLMMLSKSSPSSPAQGDEYFPSSAMHDFDTPVPSGEESALPDPALPPPPTHLEMPAIPTYLKHLDETTNPSVIVQPPATPMETIVTDPVVDETHDQTGNSGAPSSENVVDRHTPAFGHSSSVSERKFPDPSLPPPPTNLPVPDILLEIKGIDEEVSESVIVQAPSTPLESPPDLGSPIEPIGIPPAGSEKSVDDIMDHPQHPQQVDTTPTRPPVADGPPETLSSGVPPSISMIVEPPTSPPPSQSTTARSARMTSPALNAARRLPLSARIGALRRSASGSSPPPDVTSPPTFVTALSPVTSPLKTKPIWSDSSVDAIVPTTHAIAERMSLDPPDTEPEQPELAPLKVSSPLEPSVEKIPSTSVDEDEEHLPSAAISSSDQEPTGDKMDEDVPAIDEPTSESIADTPTDVYDHERHSSPAAHR